MFANNANNIFHCSFLMVFIVFTIHGYVNSEHVNISERFVCHTNDPSFQQCSEGIFYSEKEVTQT